MKKINSKQLFLPAVAILLVVLMGGCQKNIGANSSAASVATMPSGGEFSDAAEAKVVVVNLGTAGDFVILSESGITDVPSSAVPGNVGTSPITGAAIHLTCPEVTGTIYTVNAAGPACRVVDASMLTSAIGAMGTAYTDAAGRSNPTYLNLGAGNIGGKTLKPGLYKWTSAVTIPTNITISGSAKAVWIFQIAGTLSMSSAVHVTLTGGALPQNIFWQTSGAVTLGTSTQFAGVILSKTAINLKTGASVNGRLLAQTAVSLEMNAVTQP